MSSHSSGIGSGIGRGEASFSGGIESSASTSATHCGPWGRSSAAMRKTMGKSRTAER